MEGNIMKKLALLTLAVLAMPLAAQAQGIIRGAEEGAAVGNRAAGPVGGAVGGVVGGVEGGIVGGIKGILGIPQRTGSAGGRDRWDRTELSANQINDQFAARVARIKSDLRLTPEQAKNWPAVESAVKDIGKRNADLQIALRTERAQLKGPFDVIQQMREEAKFLGERSADQKELADAAQPLYASLNNQQRQRFARELQGLGHWPEG
jgi:LTXXQ motif family protein